jgi:hypothetical protein
MTRTRLIWILLILSLSPGLIAAGFREQWHELPSAVHWTAYGLAAVLLGAACTLILRSDSADRPEATAGRVSSGDDT